jgi:hypothetical protein
MVDQLAGRIDKMSAGCSHVKHGGDKEHNQAEYQKIKGDPSGDRWFPEPTVRFNMLCRFHQKCPCTACQKFIEGVNKTFRLRGVLL